MKETVLYDNIACGDIGGEWGLCIYIEYRGKKILLDTGSSDLFLKNAEKLGIDVGQVDFAVLSHAHYDHADGMRDFFRVNDHAPFYLQKEAGETCYDKYWIFHKYIGIPKGILTEQKERFLFAEGKYQICDGVWLLSHSTEGLGAIGKRNHMYVKTREGWKPDDFAHEQSLILEGDRGLILFNSCSHGGADNIIKEAQQAFPGQKIQALIGGFHLYTWKAAEVRAMADRIRQTGIEMIYTGHCTGKRAYEVLKEKLGDQAQQLKAGLVMEL